MNRLSVIVAVALSLAACATPPAPRTAPPVAPATAPRSPNGLTAVASVARTIADPRIRVGMLGDQSSVTFPRVPDGYYLIADSGPSVIRRGFTVTAPLANATVRYAVQVAALSDQTSAAAVVDRLRSETGARADAIFDPNAGLYRILAGDFAAEAGAAQFKATLAPHGFTGDLLVVRRPSDQPFDKVEQITDDEGDKAAIRSGSLLVLPVSAATIEIDDQPYRGGARVLINSRGLLNVINELNLEDYLFGVVPAEMGPKTFDELEALKAQAVAARTYAVRRLGQYAPEGYDICPGPACQAYKGFSGEDPLSNQAVTETAGIIATYEGKPIDALFTSTCGGETSDVATMFPGRADPYLKRARCVELDMLTIDGRADSGLLTEQQASARMFEAIANLPATTSWAAGDVERAALAAERVIGATPSAVLKPASSRRGDVLRYLASLMQFDDKARAVTLPEDRRYFFPQTASPDEQAFLAAAFLMKFGVLPAQDIDRVDLDAAMPKDELYALLQAWLRKHAALAETSGKILTLAGRQITIKAEGKSQTFALPDGIPIFRRLGDRLQEYRSVPVMIGDRALVESASGGAPAALVVQGNLDGASFDRTSSFAGWTRSFRADELVTSINRRYPIRQLIDIRPVSVDASHRIAELEVTAEGGRRFTIKGLPIRWSLGVSDNVFVFDKTKDPDGVDRYTFFGKGWGHGIGLCQVGSYGMAFRGYKFDQILKHYYSGIEIAPMSAAAGTSPPAH